MTEQLSQTAVSRQRPPSGSRIIIDAAEMSMRTGKKDMTIGSGTVDDPNKSLLTTKKKKAKPAYL
jgi:hypothetical protein